MDFPPRVICFLRGAATPPAVAVAWNHAEGQLGVVFRHLLGVVHDVAQVDDLLRPVEVDGGVHTGQRAVRIRED